MRHEHQSGDQPQAWDCRREPPRPDGAFRADDHGLFPRSSTVLPVHTCAEVHRYSDHPSRNPARSRPGTRSGGFIPGFVFPCLVVTDPAQVIEFARSEIETLYRDLEQMV